MRELTSLRAPISVNFELTRVCNLLCGFCSSGSATGSNRHPNRNTILRVIDALADAEVFEIRWFGGEFTTLPGWEDVLAYARERGFFMGFVSNGTLVSDRTASQLAQNGITGGAMSIHGPSEVHDRIVGCPGAFMRTVGAIRRCHEHGIAVSALFTPTRENIGSLSSLVRWLSEQRVPVHEVEIGRLCPCGEASETWPADRLTLDDYRGLFEVMRSVERTYGIRACMGDAFPLCVLPMKDWALVNGCWQGTGFGQISAEGDLKSCSLLGGTYGNVLETPLTELWMKRLAPMRRLDHLPMRCKLCPFFCGGGCSATRPGATHYAADEFLPAPGEETVWSFTRWIARVLEYYGRTTLQSFKDAHHSKNGESPISPDARPRITTRFRIREDVAGPLGFFEHHGILTLNRTGSRALALLDGTLTVVDVSTRVADECDCTPDEVDSFIQLFHRNGFLSF